MAEKSKSLWDAKIIRRALMDAVVNGQSFLLAFQDAFLMIGLIFAAMMPLIFLLRKTAVGLSWQGGGGAE